MKKIINFLKTNYFIKGVICIYVSIILTSIWVKLPFMWYDVAYNKLGNVFGIPTILIEIASWILFGISIGKDEIIFKFLSIVSFILTIPIYMIVYVLFLGAHGVPL